jgi:hypothetical protein
VPAVEPVPFVSSVQDLSPEERTVLNQSVARFRRAGERVLRQKPADGMAMHDLEVGFHQRVGRECLDPIMAMAIQLAHENPTVLERAELLVRSNPSLQSQESCTVVTVRLLGGSKVEIETPYFLSRTGGGKKKKKNAGKKTIVGKKKKPGRPRKRGKRGKAGNGCYPILAVLGFQQRVTPALASEVARLASTGTYEEASSSLKARGITLDAKQVSALSQGVAQRAVAYREWCQQRTGAGYRGTGCRGKRLAWAVDGGRVRIRTSYTRGRPRESGWRGFDAAWKEPKVLVIYEIDWRGRKVPHGLLRCDATLQDADGVFALLTSLLRQIGAHEAQQWIVLGDGAEWIWNRIPQVVEALGYDPARVIEVVDYYHAVEHLSKVAAEIRGAKPRRAWFTRAKRLLTRGDIQGLLVVAKSICKGRNAKAIRKLLGYFVDHEARMRYSQFKKAGVPTGSGAIESSVRRVINLRMKGNGIYWLAKNGEGLMHMRAQYLSGHWRALVQRALEPECFWTPVFVTPRATLTPNMMRQNGLAA